MKLRALNNKILCRHIEKGQQTTSSGIILLDDDNTESGIRPRWMQVYAVGPDVTEITKGQWIMVEHCRWTHGLSMEDHNGKFTVWSAEEEAVLLVSNEKPESERSATSAN